MKLQDKVNRPKFSRENINRENKHFNRVVDQYINWCTSGGGYEETQETYEQDIIDCLFESDTDGFTLAQYLSEYKYIEPDSELVYILDGVSTIVLYSEIVKTPGQPNRHVFRTVSSGNDTCKTPLEMFEEDLIDNDLVNVNNTIREYYSI